MTGRSSPKQSLPLGPKAPGMAAAVRAGGAIYVSGQVALDGGGNLVGAGDYELQARQCFDNVRAVLERLGAGLADVVSVTGYLADRAGNPDYLRVRSEVFATEPPATTTVIAAPTDPRFLVEVQAIAAAQEGDHDR